MKREELFTSLHDQYNTFPSSIQDAEAFHHDVFEISNAAATVDEFHSLLADRREQRLHELNNGLESASLEIIANPKLIGTQQWQYALQLFRSKSLDSLVRYFASYLPDNHPWHHHPQDQTSSRSTTTTTSSFSDAASHSTASSKPFFDDEERELFTHEPFTFCTKIPASHLPPSPRSLTMCSDSSAASPIDIDHHDFVLNTMSPARTLSFSEPESDLMVHSGMLSLPDHDDEDETSQSDDPETPTTSVSDMSEVRSLPESCPRDEARDESVTPAACENSVEESVESDTPTPRNELNSDSYISAGESCKSSSLSTKSSHQESSPLYTHVLHEYVRSSRKSRRDGSPGWTARRRSPEVRRVQKPMPDSIRVRPKFRRRIDP